MEGEKACYRRRTGSRLWTARIHGPPDTLLPATLITRYADRLELYNEQAGVATRLNDSTPSVALRLPLDVKPKFVIEVLFTDRASL